jgi:hypothetical protein
MPIESWQASPIAVPAPQYMARSAIIGSVPFTWMERSFAGTTVLTLTVLREFASPVDRRCLLC